MNNKIAFIICVFNESQFRTCVSYINDLEIPLGIEIDVVSVRGSTSIAQAYNIGLNQTDAKYKVYLQSNAYITNKTLIKDILDIFNNNKIGLIGVAGAKRLPTSGLWWEDVGKVGKFNILRNGINEDNKLNNTIKELIKRIESM